LWIMEKIMACEISFIPIQSTDYLADVNEVLSIISESGMKHTVGEMSTTITGTKAQLFALIQKIYDSMEEKTKFSMQLKLSNICGCKS